jgi:hypothetical protein
MCLRCLNKQKRITEGWKVFEEKNNLLFSPIRGRGNYLPVGKWLDEKNYRFNPLIQTLRTDTEESYQTGWHVFVKKEDAEAWKSVFQIVRKVKVFMVVATGVQNVYVSGTFHRTPRNTQVCKSIKIIPE